MTIDPNTTPITNTDPTMYPTSDPNSTDPTTNDPTTPSASDPTITMPATDPTTDDTYSSSYPMPPSPKAEPFIPALTVPASTDTPRDRAYTLHLQGYRSPAIAAHLHVPERTIRHWIQMTNQDINALPALDSLDGLTDPDQQEQQAGVPTDANATTPTATLTTLTTLTTLQHQRTLAIERHRARSAAAWALHDQLRATLDPFLARLSERLLLHTQYPDDADHVSMSTLELAGGPLSPAFRAMYHMLPGIITGLTRSLALAERADLQIDRLQGIVPPATQPATPKIAPKQPAAEPVKLQPTSADFIRAARAQRIAAEDAYIIPRLTQRQRDLIRAYCALPDPLPDGPIETWNIKIDPNAPLTRWREVLLPHGRHLDDDDDPCDPEDELDDNPDDNDPDDDPDPTPPTGKGGNHPGNPSANESTNKTGNHPGKHSGNKSGKTIGNHPGNASGNDSDKPSGTHRAPSRPHHRAPTRSRTTNGGGKDARLTTPTHAGKNAPTNPGNKIGNPGNDSGNDSGKKTGNPSG
jgi:Putative ATPase subunit of terminase (gpP-like)